MRRLLLTLSMSIAVGAGGFALAQTGGGSATAEPLCYSVSTSGTKIPAKTIGPVCVNQYPFGVACGYEQTGLNPSAIITVRYCLP